MTKRRTSTAHRNFGHIAPDESSTDKHAQQYDAALSKRQENARRHVAARIAATTLFSGDIITLKVSRERLAVHSVMLSKVYAARGRGQYSWIDVLDIDFDATEHYNAAPSTDNGSK